MAYNSKYEGGQVEALLDKAAELNVSAVDTSETLEDVNTATYVKYVAQSLTETQKAQARANIGVQDVSDLDLSGFATKSYVDEKVSDIDLPAPLKIDLSNIGNLPEMGASADVTSAITASTGMSMADIYSAVANGRLTDLYVSYLYGGWLHEISRQDYSGILMLTYQYESVDAGILTMVLLIHQQSCEFTYSNLFVPIASALEAKQDIISDLDTIRSGAALGATALQSYTEKYTGTVTGVKINGATKSPTSGVVDLGTVITEHQDISGKADKSSLATVATSGSYNDLSNKPTIPSAVTESTVSGWGFTKNTGTVTGIKMNGASMGTSGVIDLGTVITAHQSLAGYATESYVQSQISSAITTTINASY